jgi:cytochrome P450
VTPVDLLDLSDPGLYEHGVPHDLLTELRAMGPVHEHVPVGEAEEGQRFWVVVAHDEIERANRDWETFSATDGVTFAPSTGERRVRSLVSLDPPHHTRVRHLVSAGFTPRMIGKLDEHIVHRTARILDDAGARGECDFVTDVAYQLPMHVIADIVGIPDDDRPWVFQRTEAMLASLDPTSPVTDDDGMAARIDLYKYAQQLGATKREEPVDDVWTKIATGTIVDDDGATTRLDGSELDMFFIILAIAGSETTRNAISQGLLALVSHPEQLEELREHPELIDSATDEIIRWASPVLYFGRTAMIDTDLGGADISAGDRVILWYPSGNRDEHTFADPFRLDIRRNPNPHVSFGGGGPHYCLGASLAKKEVRTMTGALLDRFDTIELLGAPTWGGGGIVHNVGVSVNRLPVRLHAKA